MTLTHTAKYTLVAGMAAALLFPALTFAATPTVTDIQSQYQLLVERFESFKKNNASSTASSTRPTKAVDRTCMAAAVTAREEAIAAAWKEFNGAITTALADRTTALVTAWNSSEDNKDAIKKAWEMWRGDKKQATADLKKDRQAAWSTFKTTAKTSCKVTTPKEEGLEKEAKDSIAL